MIFVGDQHFGVNSANKNILSIQLKIWYNYIIPLARSTESDIVVVGDFFDNRNVMDIFVMNQIQKLFEDTKDITIHILLGNHDIYHKDKLEVNSLNLFAKAFDHVKLYDKQCIIEKGENRIQIVPWLLKDEQFIIDESVDLVLGHFEFKDFYVSRTYKAQHGIDISTINSNVPILSGHYHNRQRNSNIQYLGTTFQIDWNDFKEEKGIYHFDMTKKFKLDQLKFIPIDTRRHVNIIIDVDDKTITTEGLSEDLICKKATKMSYDIFRGHKLKIYFKKELAIVKNFIENIEAICESYNVEIIKEQEELDIESLIEKASTYNIESTLVDIVDDIDKPITEDIISRAKELIDS